MITKSDEFVRRDLTIFQRLPLSSTCPTLFEDSEAESTAKPGGLAVMKLVVGATALCCELQDS